MFNSPVLNVVIGLVFVYLLYSLLATIIKEMIASLFSLRANMLGKAINRMLADGPAKITIWKNMADFFGGIFVSVIKLFKGDSPLPTSLAEQFFDNPGVKYMASGKRNSKPSYLDPAVFSKAMIDVLKEGGQGINTVAQIKYNVTNSKAIVPVDAKNIITGLLEKVDTKNSFENLLKAEPTLTDKTKKYILSLYKEDVAGFPKALDNKITIPHETQKYLLSIIDDSNGDLDKFKAMLEQWFNNMMDRASGWYKRQAQLILLFIGVVVAISFNVNTIGIIEKLSKDKNAADRLATMATAYINNSQHTGFIDTLMKGDTTSLPFKQLARFYTNNQQDIDDANRVLALGWDLDKLTKPGTYPATPEQVAVLKTIARTFKPEAIDASLKTKLAAWVTNVADTNPKKADSVKLKLMAGINQLRIQIKSDSINKINAFRHKLAWKIHDSLSTRFVNAVLMFSADSSTCTIKGDMKYTFCEKIRYVLSRTCHNTKGLLGFLLTAIAISMGAPFWFDLLSKIVNLRNAGGKPDDSSDPGSSNNNSSASVSPAGKVG